MTPLPYIVRAERSRNMRRWWLIFLSNGNMTRWNSVTGMVAT